MKTISGALQTLLASSQTYTLADIYTITTASGLTLYYTDFDTDLTYNGVTCLSSGPVLTRGRTRTVIGLEVDTLDVTMVPKATDLVNGQPMLAAAVSGIFDQATLMLDRAFITGTSTIVGIINMFQGQFADLEVDRTGIKIRVNSFVADLQIKMPRNLYQPGCLNTLFGADCGLSASAWAWYGTVRYSDCTQVIDNTLSFPAGYFIRGKLTMTSGPMAGLSRTVKYSESGAFVFYQSFPTIPAIGDTFTVYPGCDKQLTTCISKFNNRSHFRGFPFVPAPETAL